MAPVSIRSPSGIQPGWCSLIEPKIAITESYGVLVGRILVDASEWSAMQCDISQPRLRCCGVAFFLVLLVFLRVASFVWVHFGVPGELCPVV